jgi:ketosteroid isomerase-like protein
MSEENVEIVRSAFGAFERGKLDEMFELVTNDLITHRVEPDNAIYHGKEGFLQATADWIEGFEEWTVDARGIHRGQRQRSRAGASDGSRREERCPRGEQHLVRVQDAREEDRSP